jgi:hypothetical protein
MHSFIVISGTSNNSPSWLPLGTVGKDIHKSRQTYLESCFKKKVQQSVISTLPTELSK